MLEILEIPILEYETKQRRHHKEIRKYLNWIKIKTQYIKIYWMQLKHCLEGKCIPLISYIENKALKSVRYKLLSTEN